MRERDADRESPTRTTEYRTWGLKRRSDRVEIFDPRHHLFIARVSEHLGLQLIEVRGDGEPTQYALGEAVNLDDADGACTRVTPFFSSLDSLDYFCRLNLQSYLAVKAPTALPRRWFWQEAMGGQSTVGARHASVLTETGMGVNTGSRRSFG